MQFQMLAALAELNANFQCSLFSFVGVVLAGVVDQLTENNVERVRIGIPFGNVAVNGRFQTELRILLQHLGRPGFQPWANRQQFLNVLVFLHDGIFHQLVQAVEAVNTFVDVLKS